MVMLLVDMMESAMKDVDDDERDDNDDHGYNGNSGLPIAMVVAKA